ncbi:MAG: hypothetical protein NVS2B7_11230 [Herpetosiphon sp.]
MSPGVSTWQHAPLGAWDYHIEAGMPHHPQVELTWSARCANRQQIIDTKPRTVGQIGWVQSGVYTSSVPSSMAGRQRFQTVS